MSKYISFTSVLQDRLPKKQYHQNGKKSLADIMEEFAIFPQRQFNLNYNRKNRAQMNNNHHKPFQLNNLIKQISNHQAQKIKKNEPEITNMTNVNKKRSLSTNNLNLPREKQRGMSKLCQLYKENEHNDSQFTWKCPKNINSNLTTAEFHLKQKNTKKELEEQPIQTYLQKYNIKKQVSKVNEKSINQQQPWVDVLKQKLSFQVEQLAKQLISQRKKQEIQQILIGSQNQDKRMQLAKNQINQYLKLKNQSKKQENSLLNRQQNHNNSAQLGAYSFSSDFQPSRLHNQIQIPNIQNLQIQKTSNIINGQNENLNQYFQKEKQSMSNKENLIGLKNEKLNVVEIEYQKVVKEKTVYGLKKQTIIGKGMFGEQNKKINQPMNVQIIQSKMVQQSFDQIQKAEKQKQIQVKVKQIFFSSKDQIQNKNQFKEIVSNPVRIRLDSNTRIIYDGIEQFKKYRQNQIIQNKNTNKENSNNNQMHNLPKLSESIKHKELNKQKTIQANKITKIIPNLKSSLAIKNLLDEKIDGSQRQKEQSKENLSINFQENQNFIINLQ